MNGIGFKWLTWMPCIQRSNSGRSPQCRDLVHGMNPLTSNVARFTRTGPKTLANRFNIPKTLIASSEPPTCFWPLIAVNSEMFDQSVARWR